MSFDPIVCGDSRRSKVKAESICVNCKRPIFRTDNWPGWWRHEEGLLLCIELLPGGGVRSLGTKGEPVGRLVDFHRIVDTLPDITRTVSYGDDWVHYYQRSDGKYMMSEHIQGSDIEHHYIHEGMKYPGGSCPCRQCA